MCQLVLESIQVGFPSQALNLPDVRRTKKLLEAGKPDPLGGGLPEKFSGPSNPVRNKSEYEWAGVAPANRERLEELAWMEDGLPDRTKVRLHGIQRMRIRIGRSVERVGALRTVAFLRICDRIAALRAVFSARGRIRVRVLRFLGAVLPDQAYQAKHSS